MTAEYTFVGMDRQAELTRAIQKRLKKAARAPKKRVAVKAASARQAPAIATDILTTVAIPPANGVPAAGAQLV